MATKITANAISTSDAAVPVKTVVEPAKLESQEDLRRRRAGIACFL